MSDKYQKEELYRRLNQARRLLRAAHDPLTKERLNGLANELERQISGAKVRDTDVSDREA